MRTPLCIDPHDRVMVLAPHPDDEILGAGGLLWRAADTGAQVRVVFVTDGENNPWTQRVNERRWFLGADASRRWATRRRAEALDGLATLGIECQQARFLGFPDQGLTDLLLRGPCELDHALRSEILGFRPTLLVLPSAEDAHPDHSALAMLLALLGLPAHEAGPERVIHYVVHPQPVDPARAQGCGLMLSREERDRKRRALLRHATQITVRRRQLLGYAAEREDYLDDCGDGVIGRLRWSQDHPRRIEWQEEGWAASVLPTKLQLLCAHPPWREGLEAMIPLHGSEVRLRRPGGPIVAAARLERLHRRCRVTLPEGVGRPDARLFAKLREPFRFFDRGGWVARDQAPKRVEPSPAPMTVEISGS